MEFGVSSPERSGLSPLDPARTRNQNAYAAHTWFPVNRGYMSEDVTDDKFEPTPKREINVTETLTDVLPFDLSLN